MATRWLGAALLMAGVVAYDPTASSIATRLAAPALFALGAGLLTGAWTAVAAAAAVLSFIHADVENPDPLVSICYPIILAGSALYVGIDLSRRFRRHVAKTRTLRWQTRRSRPS